MVIKYVSTELMIVDPLTKGLQPKSFKDHAVRLDLVLSCHFVVWITIIVMKLLFICSFSYFGANIYLY